MTHPIGLRIPEDTLAALDSAAKDGPRSAVVGRVLDRAAKREISPVLRSSIRPSPEQLERWQAAADAAGVKLTRWIQDELERWAARRRKK